MLLQLSHHKSFDRNESDATHRSVSQVEEGMASATGSSCGEAGTGNTELHTPKHKQSVTPLGSPIRGLPFSPIPGKYHEAREIGHDSDGVHHKTETC